MDDKLGDEPARLAATRRLDIFDTPRERSFDRITTLVKAILNVPVAAVSLIDENRQWFKSMEGLTVCETPRGQSFCSVAIKKREVLVVNDAASDPRFASNELVTGEPHIRSYAGAPLVLPDGYQAGALCAIGFEPRIFSDQELMVLSNLAECVVHEIELRQRVTTDALTGVMSRAAFMKRLEMIFAGAQEDRTQAFLAFLDLDHFKSVNDRFGHHTGDRVLQCLSALATETLDRNACIGRLGGEEFAVAFSGGDFGRTMDALTRLKQLIANASYEDIPGLKVTVSIGVAALDRAYPGIATWAKAADTALYAAKDAGRDRIVVAGNDPLRFGRSKALPNLVGDDRASFEEKLLELDALAHSGRVN